MSSGFGKLMNKLIVTLLMLLGMNVQAAGLQHMYSKVNQLETVAEWLEASERGVSTVKLEEKIEKESNLMLSLTKQVPRPHGMVTEEHKAFVVAHTRRFMSLVTVERNKMRIYFGAAPDTNAEYGERSFEDYISQSTSQQQNFYEILNIMEGLNYKLNEVYGVYPLHLTGTYVGMSKLTIGSYSLVRMDFNDDLPDSLIEDFLILVWSMVEKDLSYPAFRIQDSQSCVSYLSN